MILGSSQFLILSQQSKKMTLTSKVVKNSSKIIISLHQSKSVTHFVENNLMNELVDLALQLYITHNSKFLI